MKGQLNMILSVFALLLSVSILFFIYVSVSKTIIVNSDILNYSFEALASVDSTHNIDVCVTEANYENLQEKIDICRKQSDANYVEIVDIETGKKYSSGKQENTGTAHSIYKNLKAGNEIHQAKLYVKK